MKRKVLPRKLKKFLNDNNALEKFLFNIYDENHNGMFFKDNWDRDHELYSPPTIANSFIWGDEQEYWSELDSKYESL